MELAVETKEVDGVTVLALSGRIVMGEECDVVRGEILSALDAGKRKLLLELEKVRYVDSSGIGILVEAAVNTAKQGGSLKLSGLSRVLHNTLVMHRLLQAFEVYDNEAEALASFK